MRSSCVVVSLVLGAMAALSMVATARANPIVYSFAFFDSGGAQVGSGQLSVEQAVLDAAQDVSSVNPLGQVPPGSKFVEIGNLADLSFTVFGMTYLLADFRPHSPLFPTRDGVIFNADETFRQFIDANIPGNFPDSSAADVVFGPLGGRLLFNESLADGFAIEGTNACPFTFPFSKTRCSFSVARVAVPEPATLALLLTGALGLPLLRRRQRRQATA